MLNLLAEDFTTVLNEVPGSKLKQFLLTKGWNRPREVAELFELPTYKDLQKLTRTEAGQRKAKYLRLLAALPFREDVLLAEEKDAQLSILETLQHKAMTSAARAAAVKLFKHYAATMVPDLCYYYFHIARRMGADIDYYWKRQYECLYTLLTDATRSRLDSDVEEALGVPV